MRIQDRLKQHRLKIGLAVLVLVGLSLGVPECGAGQLETPNATRKSRLESADSDGQPKNFSGTAMAVPGDPLTGNGGPVGTACFEAIGAVRDPRVESGEGISPTIHVSATNTAPILAPPYAIDRDPHVFLPESAFTPPPQAAMPTHSFVGTVLMRPMAQGSVRKWFEATVDDHEYTAPYVYDYYGTTYSIESSATRLPDMNLSLVGHGSHLVPVVSGLQVTHGAQSDFDFPPTAPYDFANPQTGTGWYATFADTYWYNGTQYPWWHYYSTDPSLWNFSGTWWNYIVGPGRQWHVNCDGEWNRATVKFALVHNNQNCTFNGDLSFKFRSHPNDDGQAVFEVSQVRYQVTQGVCDYLKFTTAGTAVAHYSSVLPRIAPVPLSNLEHLKDTYAHEVADRLPERPIAQLTTDFPGAGIDLTNLEQDFTRIGADSAHPTLGVTTAGVFFNGTKYSFGCFDQFGLPIDHCEDVRLPSFSTAKSMFASAALMRLGQQYGTSVYSSPVNLQSVLGGIGDGELGAPGVVDGVREDPAYLGQLVFSVGAWNENGYWQRYNGMAPYSDDWSGLQVRHLLNMTSGRYYPQTGGAPDYLWNEGGQQMDWFFTGLSNGAKLSNALTFPRSSSPGASFMYMTSDTYLASAVMQGVLKTKSGNPQADLFQTMVKDVYRPVGMTLGSMASLRSNNGNRPYRFGSVIPYWGYGGEPWYFHERDTEVTMPAGTGIALGGYGMFVTADDAIRMAKLFSIDDGKVGTSQVLEPKLLKATMRKMLMAPGKRVPGLPRETYFNGVWSRRYGPGLPGGFTCPFSVPYFSGHGGITIGMLPNGAIYYAIGDAGNYGMDHAVEELSKLTGLGHTNCPSYQIPAEEAEIGHELIPEGADGSDDPVDLVENAERMGGESLFDARVGEVSKLSREERTALRAKAMEGVSPRGSAGIPGVEDCDPRGDQAHSDEERQQQPAGDSKEATRKAPDVRRRLPRGTEGKPLDCAAKAPEIPAELRVGAFSEQQKRETTAEEKTE